MPKSRLIKLYCLISILLATFVQGNVHAANVVNIGVLAFRGTTVAQIQWTPLAEQLSSMISDYQFQISPYDLPSFNTAVKNGDVDLVLTNPGHYVLLESKYGVTRIATLNKGK